MTQKETLRGRFLRTGLLMLVLSIAIGIAMTLIMLSIYAVRAPDGWKIILGNIRAIVDGQDLGTKRLVPFGILYGGVLCVCVALVCIFLTSRLAALVGAPLKTLKRAADNLREGDLDFEVLSCQYQELDELCLAFDSARQRLKSSAIESAEAQEKRGLLMANLSHDLRTPITAIKGYVEGIRDGIANTPEKQAHYLNTIYAKTLVLERLVRSMSDYSEYELGRMQYHFEYVDLTAFLRDLGGEYQEDADLNGLQFTQQIPKMPLTVTADRGKLKRVMDNLISNAVKYSKPGGAIWMAAEPYQGGVVIQITDNGKGIGTKALNHVFDSFFRADQARTSSVPGSGLGLAICRSIVESHRGKIWLTSEEGEGTKAFVYLPLAQTEEERP